MPASHDQHRSNRLHTLARFAKGAAIAAVAGLAALPASADILTLRDGREYKGTIVAQSPREVIIDTLVSNIRTRITVQRREIRALRLDPATRIENLINEPETPAGAIDNAGDTDQGTASTGSAGARNFERRDGHAFVIEIPLTGTFGQDFYPKGIASSLDWAAENGVTDVVFRINSGGGEVWAAMQITDIMERHIDSMRYHMLIESAISASIWPSFMCETISMAPRADFGGAVVYSQNATGSAEVDKKMNSILAAKLASSAEGNGHSKYIAPAMVISEKQLIAYRMRGTNGEWQLTDDPNKLNDRTLETVLIDGPDSVLTLTTRDAVDYGIANGLNDRSLEELARVVGIGPFDLAADVGAEMMDEWNDESADLRESLETVAASFSSNIDRFNATNRYSIALNALRESRKDLARWKRLLRDAEDLEMDAIIEGFDIDHEYWSDELKTRQDDLMRMRLGG